MAIKKNTVETDTNTETKIKNAARSVFHKKGFAASRTRDIAEEAGINLALLNYYFRSKEKLFEIIMMETMVGFMNSLAGVFNDENASFESKIETIVNNYIDLLIQEPDVPIFILSEIRANPQRLVSKINAKELISNSILLKQLQAKIKNGEIAPINPLQFIMNLVGLTVFPFVGSPLLKVIGGLDEQQFNYLMEERKKMIPIWVNAILKTNTVNK